MDPSKIRDKIGRFRILVIGRANAGKTTILQRVCNTRDNPEIYNRAGKKIDATVLMASTERGEHDIENEMVFRSNPEFVFHDSRGFEAGGESEFDKVKAFIARRSEETKLQDRLHVIWFCIPMDEASRSFTEGEKKFFSQCDTGSIPVMVLFTKFDALYDVAYAELKSKGASIEEAGERAPKHAEESFAIGPQLKFLYHSKVIQRPPKCHVCLPNMDNDDADCAPLIERTARTLDSEVLQQLFVSTQQTNLELCMKYAVQRILSQCFDSEKTASKGHQDIIGRLCVWFPHIVVDEAAQRADWYRAYRLDDPYAAYDEQLERYARDYQLPDADQLDARDREYQLGITRMNKETSYRDDRTAMGSRLLSAASGSSSLGKIVQLSSAAVIILEHSFYIFEKRRYPRDKPDSVPSCLVALEQYMASPHAVAVREAVGAAVQAFEEAVTAATHAYEEAMRIPAWIAKLPFERFQRKVKEAFERSKEREKEYLCSQAKARLIKTILEITLNHRLPRP